MIDRRLMMPAQVNDKPSGFTFNFFPGHKSRGVSGFSIEWIFERACDGKMLELCSQIGFFLI